MDAARRVKRAHIRGTLRRMSIQLRAAGPEDAAQIHRLIVALATYEREPDAVEATPEDLRAQLSAPRPPFECLLAELDGAVCLADGQDPAVASVAKQGRNVL